MVLKLYNTLTRKKEIFKPIVEGKTGIYGCGPTVYNYVHIGNHRTNLLNDFVRRSLSFLGYKVTFVMNTTDVDDKTIKGSKKEGISLKEFTRKYEKIFLEDINSLNIKKPDYLLRATDNINEMVKLIEELLEKGYAYKASDGIYFSVGKFKSYGKLAKLKNLKETKERISNDEYDKENVRDFALWKFYTDDDGDAFWETEIGKGRPGWSIECSAMSMKILGETIDIHTGGADLIFPHHTNEIAQSECATGKQFVKYWIHGGMLTMKDKMSKSLGNVFYLNDLEQKGYSPLDFRYLCLLTHYRKPLDFTMKHLGAAKNALSRLRNILSELKESKERVNFKKVELVKKEFIDFINDDLNLPRGISYMWEILRDDKLTDSEKYKCVLEFDKVFGLDLGREEKVKIPKEVNELLEKRNKARQEKDFTTADKYRDEIKEKGFVIEDKDGGSVLKRL
ncbi:MAG: cysteine--tRNA ligase [Candidatus Pacearchaeota archaeon]|jgi:cysteinyl-tRNA synthetase